MRENKKSKSGKETPPQKPPEAPEKPEPEGAAGERCPVVGVGASAGGVEAFTDLLQHMQTDTGMAFVLIGHLDPKHQSLLTELLSRSTRMPVSEITEGVSVEGNHVYVIPPNASVSISAGKLHLEPRQLPHMPIDRFFRSLAQDMGSKSIGVILSGTGSDGTFGLKAIKAEGGITFAQDDKTAKYNGMPRSAIQAGCVDFVMAPEGIARELVRLCQHPYVAPPASSRGEEGESKEQFGTIFTMLRNTTGVDFGYYKHATIRRRIQRRMALHKMEKVEPYIDYLRANPQELTSLFHDILINVTSFFREAPTFDALKEKVFPTMLRDRSPEDPVRVWVPGCATGEEAYSVAVCLIEYLRENDVDTQIQVFGTDLSETSLEKARAGIYPDSIAADVSPERLRRFFFKVNGSYQISRAIRDMCVFARQNLTKDPPFSKLDLITCRNVLIYLGPVLQNKVLRYFHYGLKPTGHLVLGNSESVAASTELFNQLPGKDRIYVKKMAAQTPNLDVGGFEERHRAGEPARPHEWAAGGDLQRKVDQLILAKHSPAGVVVDDDLKVLQFRGRTSPYLEHSAGQSSLNLLQMTRGGLGVEIRKLIQKAKNTGAPAASAPVRVTGEGETRTVSIVALPVKGPHQSSVAYLVMFEPVSSGQSAIKKPPERQGRASRVEELEQELTATKQYLQTVIEEQEASREELQSAHEEVQSSNEELQSTNEELLTSKEELQSTNEELNTVNEEMQGRNAELTQINNDLNNLLSSVNIPIVMLGSDLRVRRFTPQAEKVLNLLPTDLGRKVTDFRIKLNISDPERLFLDVIENLHTQEREVQDQDGRIYSMSVRPYRTGDNKIDGAVMTLFDVTDRRLSEVRYHRQFDSSPHGIILMEGGTETVLDINQAVIELSGYPRRDWVGRKLREVGFLSASLCEELKNLKEDVPLQSTLILHARQGAQVDVELSANAYREDQTTVVQVMLRDIGERLSAEKSQRQEEGEQQKAEKVEAVARLAGGMANDLNNLLTTIVGYSDLLRNRPSSGGAMDRDLDEIRKAGERATHLARQLLAFGRKQVSQPKVLDLNRLVNDMEQVMRVLLNERIELEVKTNATGSVVADESELEQVITTLLLSARDSMPEGGHLIIQTANSDGNMVMLSVTDTGAGLDAETQSHLFEPFFSKGRTGGMGFTALHNIVSQSGGSVRIQSELGKGTTLQVLLPRAKESAPSEIEHEDARGTETILLVEDDPALRRLCATILRDRGYTVLEAANGPEALQAAKDHPDEIHLLVTNLIMPRMSGREVSDRLLAERPDMKVLVVSGHAEDVVAQHGVLEGSFEFLKKPFTPKTLAWKVRTVLDA